MKEKAFVKLWNGEKKLLDPVKFSKIFWGKKVDKGSWIKLSGEFSASQPGKIWTGKNKKSLFFLLGLTSTV